MKNNIIKHNFVEYDNSLNENQLLIASVWKIIISRLLDIIFVSLIITISLIFWKTNIGDIYQLIIKFIISIIILFLYFVVFPWLYKGRTIFKIILNINLLQLNKKDINWFKISLLRELFITFIPFITMMICIIISAILLPDKINENITSTDKLKLLLSAIFNILASMFLFAWYIYLLVSLNFSDNFQITIDIYLNILIVDNSKLSIVNENKKEFNLEILGSYNEKSINEILNTNIDNLNSTLTNNENDFINSNNDLLRLNINSQYDVKDLIEKKIKYLHKTYNINLENVINVSISDYNQKLFIDFLIKILINFNFIENEKLILNNKKRKSILSKISNQYDETIINEISNKISNYKINNYIFINQNDEYIYNKYNNYLKNNNLFDHDDIYIIIYKLLTKNKKILNQIKKTYQYIIIDHFENINDIQFSILMLLISYKKSIIITHKYLLNLINQNKFNEKILQLNNKIIDRKTIII